MRAAPVEIELAGTRYELVPTLRAGDRLNRAYGGFRPVVDALARWDLDAATDVVLAGANLPAERKTDVRQAIFDEGLAVVALTLSRFVAVLASGGQDASEEGGAPGKPNSRSDGRSSPSG